MGSKPGSLLDVIRQGSESVCAAHIMLPHGSTRRILPLAICVDPGIESFDFTITARWRCRAHSGPVHRGQAEVTVEQHWHQAARRG